MLTRRSLTLLAAAAASCLMMAVPAAAQTQFRISTASAEADWLTKALAKFKEGTSRKWMARSWQDKLAAGFTVSASWGGDKQNTLYQLLTLAQQHGMVWVGLGLAPGNNHSKGSSDDLNRTGASLGVMAQANADQGNEGIGASEFRTAQALGKRVAEAALRWHAEAPLARAA